MTGITILYGGSSKERLVSVASAQALSDALPDADLWFWDEGDVLHKASTSALKKHERPFEHPFKPDGNNIGPLLHALDLAKKDKRVLLLALHGGIAENGELQTMCEMRGVPFTGSGSASSHIAFDKIAAKQFAGLAGVSITPDIALDDMEPALRQHGKLIAKPTRDGSSYGLIFVNATQDIVAVRRAAETEDYLIEPFVTGPEATCGVLEQEDGSLLALPPVEIVPAEGAGFDYVAKYLSSSTQEICPARFSNDINAKIMGDALKAHRALSCRGYSRSDFIVSADGPVFLETNTLPGLTKASLYPKALAAQGIGFADFLLGQIVIAKRRISEARD